jgi:hypothetical protein
MATSAELRRWATCLRTWSASNPYPSTVAQMRNLATEFELMAFAQDAAAERQPQPRRKQRYSARTRELEPV